MEGEHEIFQPLMTIVAEAIDTGFQNRARGRLQVCP